MKFDLFLQKETLSMYIQRLMSLQDRNPLSPTYGCFDRTYWFYKTIQNFPSATFQQPMMALAFLWGTKFNENGYYKNKLILNSAKAALNFWSSIQNKNGSFNEWYRNENSFCATAFTTYAATETFKRTSSEITTQKTILIGIQRALNWLKRNNNHFASNQMISAAAALYNGYEIFKDNLYLSGYQEKIGWLLKNQSEEGWFPEYGGADISYSFVLLDVLAPLAIKTQDQILISAIKKLINFLGNFVHQDGSVGGDYGSREGNYFLPYGISLMYPYAPEEVCRILMGAEKGLENGNLISPLTCDDKYFCYFFLCSFILCFMNYPINRPQYVERSKEDVTTKFFSKSGFIIIKTSSVEILISAKKGGILKVFSQDKLKFSDSGIAMYLDNGRYIYSGFPASNNFDKELKLDEVHELKFEYYFHIIEQESPLKKYPVIIQAFFVYVLSFPLLSRLFNNYLKNKKIFPKKIGRIKLYRSIKLDGAAIVISDIITKFFHRTVKDLFFLSDLNIVHSPSTRYFSFNYLRTQLTVNKDVIRKIIDYINYYNNVIIERKFDLASNELFVEVKR